MFHRFHCLIGFSFLALVLAIGPACGGDGEPTLTKPSNPATPTVACRLPTPQPGVDPTSIPDTFLPAGEPDVTRTEERRGRLAAVLTIPGTVQSVLHEYQERVRASEFDLLQKDNEGFEAELYLQKGRGDLAVVQIRETGCTDTVLVLLNLPAER